MVPPETTCRDVKELLFQEERERSSQRWENKQLTVKLLCERGFHDGTAGQPAAIIYTHTFKNIYIDISCTTCLHTLINL